MVFGASLPPSHPDETPRCPFRYHERQARERLLVRQILGENIHLGCPSSADVRSRASREDMEESGHARYDRVMSPLPSLIHR